MYDATIGRWTSQDPIGFGLHAFDDVVAMPSSLPAHYTWATRDKRAEAAFKPSSASYYDGNGWFRQDAKEFEAGDSNLYRYVKNAPTNRTDPAGLYEVDVHFYMTYYIAASIGFHKKSAKIAYRIEDWDRKAWAKGIKRKVPVTLYHEESMAFAIAWANQYTDDDDFTTPMTYTNLAARRKYHFRHANLGERGGTVKPGKYKAADVEQYNNDDIARDVVEQGIKEKNDGWSPYLVGIGLHAYQDSWSHEGYHFFYGHSDARCGGHFPDWPWVDVGRAMQMAEGTYNMLLKYYRTLYGANEQPWKTWDQIKGDLEKQFNEAKGPPIADHLMKQRGGLGTEHPAYSRETQARVTSWLEFTQRQLRGEKDVTGETALRGYSKPDLKFANEYAKSRRELFLSAARRVKDLPHETRIDGDKQPKWTGWDASVPLPMNWDERLKRP